MTAHPPDLASRVSDDQAEIGYVLRNHRTSSDEGIPSDLDSADDCRVGANRAAPLQTCSFVQRVAVHLRPGIGDIRQHARWSEKYVVFNHHTCINRYIVLDFDVASDDRAAVYVHVLPDDAALADSSALHDMREVPYLRTGSNLGAFINIGRFVYEVRAVLLVIFPFKCFWRTYGLPTL